jgi:hypothetical protein
LICLALKRYPVALTRAAGDVKLEDLLRFDDLLALALLASLLLGNDLARS